MNNELQKKSYRKPFKPPMDKGWWHKLSYFLFYIIRESTAFFMLWISIVLTFGVICAYSNPQGQDEFYRFIFFLQSPFVVIMNVLALISALFHTFTWFNLAPKAVNVVIGGKKPPAALFVISLWAVAIAVSIFMLLLVMGYFR